MFRASGLLGFVNGCLVGRRVAVLGTWYAGEGCYRSQFGAIVQYGVLDHPYGDEGGRVQVASGVLVNVTGGRKCVPFVFGAFYGSTFLSVVPMRFGLW